MKAGQVYRVIETKTGEEVLLRSIRWDDLETLVDFVNSLVRERLANDDFGLGLDRLMTREEELRWLAAKLVEIEEGNLINVAAFYNSKIIGNSEIKKERYADRRHYGILGIAILSEWRNKGIGREMMLELFEQARKESMTNLQLEVLSNNKHAIHLYEELGFKKVGIMPNKVIRNKRYYDVIYMSKQL